MMENRFFRGLKAYKKDPTRPLEVNLVFNLFIDLPSYLAIAKYGRSITLKRVRKKIWIELALRKKDRSSTTFFVAKEPENSFPRKVIRLESRKK